MTEVFGNVGDGVERSPRWHALALIIATSFVVAAGAAASGMILVGCGDRLGEARSLEASGDWAAALTVYEEVLADNPEDVQALSGAAVALQVLGRFDEALAYQERVVAADVTDATTRVELGFNYLNHQDRPEEAARVLAEAVELQPTAKNLVFLSQALEAVDDLEGAERSLRKALVVDPGYGYAYAQLIALLEEQGRADEAAEVKAEAAARSIALPESSG